ncbi:MAG: hypothetical protein KY466_08630, partial [Gemmatimonadetes bacterium]|nr:hypothetical protein [Gemmatimonadota bacterium]
MRKRRIAVWTAVGIAALGVLLLAAVLMLTRTDRGRERVRGYALERLEEAIDGEVEIGRIEGDLLKGARLIDVAIRDRQGRPFLEADTLETRFRLRALLRQRIALSDVRVVNAVVVLDQPPGEEWNYVRIFGLGEEGTGPGGESRWGHWIALDDVTLVDSRVHVRAEWHPPEGATPAERQAALREALAGDTREHVVEAPGGYQNVMDFRELDAELPRVLIAHPDTAGTAVSVARLGGLVRPFSPPPARVRDLSGQVRLLGDSLFLSGVRAVLPGSRLAGGAAYDLHSGDLLLIARGAPVAFGDLRWLEPRLPERGGGEMMLRLELGSVVDRILAWDVDVAIGDATVEGRFELTTGDTVRFGDTDLRFARVETEMVERLFDVEFPRSGRLTGELALAGRPRSLQVDGDIRFDDRVGPTSRIVAVGGLGVEPDVRFDELRLRFAPLHAGLARAALPDLPLSGTIEGTAVLSGTLALLDLDADLALRDPRHGLSRVRLAGGLDRREELRLRDMVVRMDPLRLDLLRDDLPELPAGATATGRVSLDGMPARALSVDGDILLDDPATGVSGIGATGEIVFADELRFRSLRLRFSPLQAELVRVAVPELPLRGSIEGTALLTGTLAAMDLEADLTLRDPRHGRSRVIASGGLDRGDELRLRNMVLRMDPLRLDLLRGELPELPPDAAVTGLVTLDGAPSRALSVDGDIVVDDPATGRSEIGARGRVAFEEGLRFDDLTVRMTPLRVDLVRPWIPDLPAGGRIEGQLALDGAASGFLHVDGRLSHHHETMGASAFQVSGGVDLTGPLEFRGFDVRMEPLHMALVRPFLPDLPLAGTLSGTARLDGSPASRIAIRGDVVHQEPGERSHVVGTVEVVRGAGGWAAVDVRLDPLSLDVAGRFLPAAGLRGTVAGRLRTTGDMDDLRVDADLRVADGGTIRLDGMLDLASATPVYDVDMDLLDFDLAAVTVRAPAAT